MKKLVCRKNRYLKSVNNHKIPNHKFALSPHIVSKGLEEIYSKLAPIYQELADDYEKVDLMDLEFYERWLNG